VLAEHDVSRLKKRSLPSDENELEGTLNAEVSVFHSARGVFLAAEPAS
jgi:hypothetical protein